MTLSKFNIDQVNIVMMLVSCAVAYAVPFELVLVSYAFLGPAHYLTEISWLHDRDYFTGTKWIWVPLTLMVAISLWFRHFTEFTLAPIFIVTCMAFALSGAMALAKKTKSRAMIFTAFMAVFTVVHYTFPGFDMALAMLLPTVIHIFFFTGFFILIGALKGKNIWAFISLLVFIACGVSYIFIVPSTMMISTDFVDNNLGNFDRLVDYLVSIASFGGLVNGHSVLAFLSFAYTYHYLNWFSKTEVIKWHLIPRKRLYLICALYCLFISIVLYDFTVGFIALRFLSITHVFLEFPLNVLSMKMIGTSIIPKRSGYVHP